MEFFMSLLVESLRGKLQELREYWRSWPPEKKEGMFFLPLHLSVSVAILKKLWESGMRPIELVMEKPALALAGVLGSGIYLKILSQILERATE